MATDPKSPAPGTYQRGEDSRQRIVEAALDIFGRYGFEGATTRQLARSAEVNLAAIAYYFGGKEGLYQAVAEHVIGLLSAKQAPIVAKAKAALADPNLSKADALDLLLQILDSLTDMMIGTKDADRWARFLLREQLDPTPTFDIVYDGFMLRIHGTCSALVARITDAEPDDETVLIRVSTIIGQILVFRAARAAIQRRLGWTDFAPVRVAAIKSMVREQVTAILSPVVERT